MVGDGESGGTRAIRAWATEAAERGARLIGRGEDGHPVPAEEFEGPVADLSRLRDLLDHDRQMLGKVTLVLGGLLAVRHATGQGAPDDPERVRSLLDEVRDRTTAAGERMTEEDRQWAAMFLMLAAAPTGSDHSAGRPQDIWPLLDRAMAAAPGQASAEAARIAGLAAEIQRMSVPAELRDRLGNIQDVLSYLSESDLSDPEALLAMLPPDLPFGDQLRTLLSLVPSGPDSPAPPGPESKQGPGPEPGAGPGPEPEDEAGTAVASAWFASLLGAQEALHTGHPEALDRLLQRLRGLHDSLSAGHDRRPEIQNLMHMVLQLAGPLGGSRTDGDKAHQHRDSIVEYFVQWAADNPAAAHLTVAARASDLLNRLLAEEETENEEEYLRLVGELDALDRSTPADHPFRRLVMLAHGTALSSLGQRTGDTEMAVRGLAQQEAALAAWPAADIGIPEAQLAAVRTAFQTSRAVLGQTPDLMPDPVQPDPDASAGTRYLAALTATLRHSTTQDPADLDAAIAGLEQVRGDVRQGGSPQIAAPALWQLAENYRLRLSRTEDPADRDAATDAALESLQALAADVALQSGPDHGLLAARSGADRGVRAARWAAWQGRFEEAVAALELGRSLVLQAAATSRAVPDLLERRGHHDLAEEWRTAEAGGASAGPEDETRRGPGNGAVRDPLSRELPSSLRRHALEALGHREPGGVLFRTPTVDELTAGVAEADADALVYLLPGEGEAPGLAVVVGPDIGTGAGPLPLLSGDESGPLERYLDAAAAYQEQPGAPGAAQAWEEALSQLCDWAMEAVIAPVMRGIAQRLAAAEDRRRDRPGPPRIVLVPCGRLGIVPWHAARLPAAAPHDYACQILVISYAASGRQFLNTVRRTRRDPAASPVLVADPTMTLPYVELEVAGLQQALYPEARLFGEFYEPPVEPAAAGSPDDLLDALAAGPSLLHVACHGSAGTSPTASALHLAPGVEGAEGRRDDGLLTVSRLLDRPMGEPGLADGPLVVLSACETDLSKRDHDEALTLTTAFVASGARDVVGSRWATQDSAAALMMAVFHHYVAIGEMSPVDALRAAQMWMLDPRRENPGSLSTDLVDELAGAPDLHRPAAWAAFIHQGHPGPSTTKGHS
ncbi:CHAT domain-containing protein [Streptomyces poriferorum]|uniref:CHAT domain-containing protein n=1 Tax=Streptomyces poriferorum TaxID=2798799 RepID=UPI00273E8942|nr:CHAT domain-containing protein [Streptomyces sp. Alt1]WLQ47107.1 CHAT domain-containing protein [Streptomyces sp. Alt1]